MKHLIVFIKNEWTLLDKATGDTIYTGDSFEACQDHIQHLRDQERKQARHRGIQADIQINTIDIR